MRKPVLGASDHERLKPACPATEMRHDIRFPTISKASDQPAHTRSLIRALASRLNIILTEHHLEFLSLKGDCTGYSRQITTLLEITYGSNQLA